MKKTSRVLNPGWKWYWKEWEKAEPPYRPSKAEIKFWERVVKKNAKKKNCRVLVLGTTPEIRDLLARYKLDVTLVDINPEMYRSMNKLMRLKNPKEKFVRTNWLQMDKVLPLNHFDIVLGDSPHSNILFSEYDKFFKNIYLSLKKEGILCLGTAIISPKEKGISYETLIKVYRKDPSKFKEFKWQKYYLYKTGFSDKDVFNPKNLEFKEGVFDKKIEDLFKKGKITKNDLKYLQFKVGNYTDTFPSPYIFNKTIKKYFKILEFFIDPLSKKYPIMKYKRDYILEKKKEF